MEIAYVLSIHCSTTLGFFNCSVIFSPTLLISISIYLIIFNILTILNIFFNQIISVLKFESFSKFCLTVFFKIQVGFVRFIMTSLSTCFFPEHSRKLFYLLNFSFNTSKFKTKYLTIIYLNNYNN